MEDSFEDKLVEWIKENGIFEEVDRVLLAVSGGADSAAMVHVLAALKRARRLSCEFVIGHVNHGLRAEASDGDERFVREMADDAGIKFISESIDVRGYATEKKLSIETAGRHLRLKTLAAMAASQGCGAIATAHHKDDLAETMVHRLIRGTGFRGLCGIRPVSYICNTKFIRPMLTIHRDEIIQYCKDRSIQWREDTSNRNLDFTRNRIRHQILPVLKAESGEIVNKLYDLSQQCRHFQLVTENDAHGIIVQGQFGPDLESFSIAQNHCKDVPCWVFYEVVREVLMNLGVGLMDYTQLHFDAIYALLDQKEAVISMPGLIHVGTKKGILRFYKEVKSPSLSLESVQLDLGKTVSFGPWKISCRQIGRSDADAEHFFQTKDAFVEWFDADKVRGPLTIRERSDGDRFRPIGGSGEKKIARFLQDGQFDAGIKQDAFVISDAEEILWVAPIRMSENVKITKKTRLFLEIRVFRS